LATLKGTRAKSGESRTRKDKMKREIIGICLLSAAALCLVGIWVGDRAGSAGRIMASFLQALSGEGKYLFPVFLLAWGLQYFSSTPQKKEKRFLLAGGLLFFLALLSLLHHLLVRDAPPGEILYQGWQGKGGGLLGGLGLLVLNTIFGPLGTWIVLVALMIISIMIITELSPTLLFSRLGSWLGRVLARVKEAICNFIYVEVEEEPKEEKKAFTEGRPHREVKEPLPRVLAEESPARIYPENPPEIKQETRGEMKTAIRFSSPESYVLPPLSLLLPPPKSKSLLLEKEIAERIKLLEETLESFGVKVKVTQVSCGPTVTRYEVQPAPGIKVSRIINLADDIALSLAAPQVRIEAPIPGKSAVGIEVPNREISTVYLREVLEDPVFMEARSKLTVALGKDIAGSSVIADLAQMPHLLIAGTTGSGKSVCLNALICSLLFKATPQELKLILIDPKMVELTQYNGIPHLLAPVVTQPKKAASALQWAVREMERRYELFAEVGVKDILRYNAKVKETASLLPYIVIFIDELADLMMVAPADVEGAICRLAQMARAAGIHLVVATQRPSVDVITGLIKANMSSRIAFAVSSQVDSRTILDMAGAEKLLGRGDMLFFPIGAAKPIRVQGVYVSDREVENLVTFIKEQARPEYEPTLLKGKERDRLLEEEEDQLFPEAVRVVLETGQASISLLQRRLRIGYARAARLIDLMESRGLVGSADGAKPRPVLTTWEEYNRLFGPKE